MGLKESEINNQVYKEFRMKVAIIKSYPEQ